MQSSAPVGFTSPWQSLNVPSALHFCVDALQVPVSLPVPV
jgi:hypothetical protein